jgi:hypothetical protein
MDPPNPNHPSRSPAPNHYPPPLSTPFTPQSQSNGQASAFVQSPGYTNYALPPHAAPPHAASPPTLPYTNLIYAPPPYATVPYATPSFAPLPSDILPRQCNQSLPQAYGYAPVYNPPDISAANNLAQLQPSTNYTHFSQNAPTIGRKRRLSSAVEDTLRRPPGPSGYSGPAPAAGPLTYTQPPHHAVYTATQRPLINTDSTSQQGSSRENAIDLTGLYSHARHSSMMQSSLASTVVSQPQSRQQISSTREHVLPVWQPDAEVTHCFVCSNQFSFFYRKHHCRRCGRVVCANCSPHRITLPRQFIVQPPTLRELQDEEGSATNQDGLGGGEEVRVCNPCVPDPNYNPPGIGSHQGLNSGMFPSNMHYSPHWTMPPGVGGSHQPGEPSRVFVGASGRTYNWPTRPTGHRTSYSAANVPRTPQFDPSNRGYAIPGSGPYGAPVAIQMPQSMPFGHRPPPGAYQSSVIQDLSSFFNPNDANNSTQASSSRDPPPPPPPQIAEEDECPVCSEELPPKGPNDDMTAREAHIESCLQSHMYSSSAPQARTGQFPTDTGQAPSVGGSPAQDLPYGRVRRMTRGHMLTYKATEKDCIGPDGVAPECVICLEEFHVNDELARMECLCKFHKVRAHPMCKKTWILTSILCSNVFESGGTRKGMEAVPLTGSLFDLHQLRTAAVGESTF